MRIAIKEDGWISLGVIFLLSTAIAFGFIGRQVFSANWGVIDDHAIFLFLGTDLRLPLADFFHTLLTKTEVGNLNYGRFRPSYYFFTLLETVIWGANVHLWYLARTLWFATFIASLWWLLNKFVRIWLGAALLLPILFLPFWAGIWARLGPSEIYGTLALAFMLFGIYAAVYSKDESKRKWAAALITFAAVLLVGSKETFIPLAGAAVATLIFVGFTRRIPIWMAVFFLLVICLYAAGIVFVIQRSVLAVGEDFYARTIDMRQLAGIAWHALSKAVFGSGLAFAYAVTIFLFGYWARRTNRDLRDWMRSSCVIVVIFIFMAAVYFSQQVTYQGELPLRTRYDFPALLFVPFGYDVLICYVFYQLRSYLHSRATNYISLLLALAIFVTYMPKFVRFQAEALPRAVSVNIEKTNIFFNEISALVARAKQSPRDPIILEAYDADSYEALTSIRNYVRAFGAINPVSVRSHATENSKAALADRLEQRIKSLENEDDGQFVPLSKSLASPESGCISVGINGAASGACAAFEVRA
jgi:hypothetical protein